MGIKGLHKFLRDKFPNVYHDIHISKYSYETVAIDTSLYLYKFRATKGENWLNSFVTLIGSLRKNQIHCTFVFDNGASSYKDKTKEVRNSLKEKHLTKIDQLSQLLEEYDRSKIVDEDLIQFFFSLKKKGSSPKRMLGPDKSVDMKEVIPFLRKELHRLKNMYPTGEDFELLRSLFNILNVPWINAPLEAETTCSDLCKQGLVKAVLSEDSDVLAYSAPLLLLNYDMYTGTCRQITHKDLIDQMEVSEQQFLDFCILCGTDYNPNIRDVGPVAAYKLITRFGSIEEIENQGVDTSILNYKKVRELFLDYQTISPKIPFCAQPDFETLFTFLSTNSVTYNQTTIRENFSHEKVSFIDITNEEVF